MTATLAPANDTAALAMAMASTALDAQKRAEAAEQLAAEKEAAFRKALAALSTVTVRINRLVNTLESDRSRKLSRQTMLDAVRGLL